MDERKGRVRLRFCGVRGGGWRGGRDGRGGRLGGRGW